MRITVFSPFETACTHSDPLPPWPEDFGVPIEELRISEKPVEERELEDWELDSPASDQEEAALR